PIVGQPTPDRWVRLNPVMSWSSYRYPPPDGRPGVSGLHCTMPNGTLAPGNASTSPTTGPPLPVPMNVLTIRTSTANILDNVVLPGAMMAYDRSLSLWPAPSIPGEGPMRRLYAILALAAAVLL